MSKIFEPLRLAVGSHEQGSGKGCAMNVVSWENGDSTITDFPACADRLLARVVQRVNDSYCTHSGDGDGLLCAPCSVLVLELAHRTVGTDLRGHLTPEQIRKVWVRLALDEADSVASEGEHSRVTACREAVRDWLAGTVTIQEVRSKHTRASARAYAYAAAYDAAACDAHAAAAYAAAYDAASAAGAAAAACDAPAYDAAYAYDAYAYAYHAAHAAAHAAACAYASDASDAASSAASAYDTASYAGVPHGEAHLLRAHALIDRFERYTGIHAVPVDEGVTADAVAKMLGQ
jgi:hypothetical protein